MTVILMKKTTGDDCAIIAEAVQRVEDAGSGESHIYFDGGMNGRVTVKGTVQEVAEGLARPGSPSRFHAG